MVERKQQILDAAISIIATEGYGKLTMRAVARASGIKLGALQYHFRTWADLLNGLAERIADLYEASFSAFASADEAGSATVQGVVSFLLEDKAGETLDVDRLFPQLWAMSLVEPIIEDLLDHLYAELLDFLETPLAAHDVADPKAEAIVIVGMLDGLTNLVGRGRRWADRSPAVAAVVQEIIDERYGSL